MLPTFLPNVPSPHRPATTEDAQKHTHNHPFFFFPLFAITHRVTVFDIVTKNRKVKKTNKTTRLMRLTTTKSRKFKNPVQIKERV